MRIRDDGGGCAGGWLGSGERRALSRRAHGRVVGAGKATAAALADRVSIRKGQAWLRAHQAPGATDPAWAPWRAHSLNFDREHGGPKGEPWRRLFMSDLATAFAALALM